MGFVAYHKQHATTPLMIRLALFLALWSIVGGVEPLQLSSNGCLGDTARSSLLVFGNRDINEIYDRRHLTGSAS